MRVVHPKAADSPLPEGGDGSGPDVEAAPGTSDMAETRNGKRVAGGKEGGGADRLETASPGEKPCSQRREKG